MLSISQDHEGVQQQGVPYRMHGLSTPGHGEAMEMCLVLLECLCKLHASSGFSARKGPAIGFGEDWKLSIQWDDDSGRVCKGMLTGMAL